MYKVFDRTRFLYKVFHRTRFMLKVFDQTRLMLKTIPKQVSKIKFTQIVTTAQLSDTAPTQNKQINVYISCIFTLIKFQCVRPCPKLCALVTICVNLILLTCFGIVFNINLV